MLFVELVAMQRQTPTLFLLVSLSHRVNRINGTGQAPFNIR